MKTIKIAALVGLLGVVAPAFAEVPWYEVTARSNETINPKKLEDFRTQENLRKQEMLKDSGLIGVKKIRTKDFEPQWWWGDDRPVNLNRAKDYAEAKSVSLKEKAKQRAATQWRDYGHIDPDEQERRHNKIADWSRVRYLPSQENWAKQQKQKEYKRMMKRVKQQLDWDEFVRNYKAQ